MVKLDIISNENEKKIVITSSRALHYFIFLSGGEFQKRIIDEPMQETFCGVDFPRNHKFYENFNRKITQLYEAGITERYSKHYYHLLDLKYYERPRLIHKKYLETTWRKSFIKEPKILSMRDLEFGFVIWLGSLVFPLIAFVLEWFKRLKEFLVIHFLLAAYFEIKYSESSKKSGKPTRIDNTSACTTDCVMDCVEVEIDEEFDEPDSESQPVK
jgi:hypothetical protein